MPKVSVIVVIYNSRKFIKPVFDAIFAQTHKELEVIAVINADDGAEEILKKDYPQVKILKPNKNLGFAGGNNLGIKESSGEFIQLVNPDLILEPDYVEKLLQSFDDSRVAAATGKLLRYDFKNNQKTRVIDSTGIIMSVSGRARDRGQNEIDRGQYDYQLPTTNHQLIFGVSGAGPMYRRNALEQVKWCSDVVLNEVKDLKPGSDSSSAKWRIQNDKRCEYFDEDFMAYWEDVDLSWRLNRAGFKNIYVPEALAFHGRAAGQAKGGYLKIWNFIRHHKKLSPAIRRLNYKNHILMYIKNAPFIFHPAFLARELAMFVYVLIFEPSTLSVVPQLFGQIPRILRKRKASRHIRTN